MTSVPDLPPARSRSDEPTFRAGKRAFVGFLAVGLVLGILAGLVERATGGGIHSRGGGSQIFLALYSHVPPHPITAIPFGDVDLPVYNIQLFQLLAVLAMFAVFFHVRRSLERAAAGRRMGTVARIFSGFVLFVRDEMVMPVLGEEDGRRFLPYFLFVFFFVAFMNLWGLVPHGLTATACVFVTGALAATTLAVMIGGGMAEQGAARFWKNLLPPGLPGWLVPLMFFVELIGLLVKPFALMIRLFANMLAGHLVVLSFMGLIFYFAGEIGAAAWGIAVPSVALGVFIMIIEGFIALLQAYIFAYLSILFVGMCRHPQH